MGYLLYFSQGGQKVMGVSCGHNKWWFTSKTSHLRWVQNLEKPTSKYKDKSLYDNHESKPTCTTSYKYLLKLDLLIQNFRSSYGHSPKVNVWCSFLWFNPQSIFKIGYGFITNKSLFLMCISHLSYLTFLLRREIS